MKKILIIAATLALAGAGCASQSSVGSAPKATVPAAGKTQSAQTTASQAAIPAAETSNEANALVVKDQLAGNSISIAYVKLAKRGYAAIQADTNGKPGKILAVSDLLFAGENKEVPIHYTTTNKTSYWIVLYSDNGNGKFDALKDAKVEDSAKHQVMETFKMTSDQNLMITHDSTVKEGSDSSTEINRASAKKAEDKRDGGADENAKSGRK